MPSTIPAFLLLLFNGYVLVTALLDKKTSQELPTIPVLLFFCSGMSALIYQIVWQRALFAIYGVNSESVAVVVSAFMIGLGLGSLLGGWLSRRYSGRAILVFGIAELGVAIFGLLSLSLFHWVAGYTAGAALSAVVPLSLALLLVPTVSMGATLPLLAEHLMRTSQAVGYSVGILYFANTFGSALACFLCAKFLMRDFGQSGSVQIAACINAIVAVTALVFGHPRSNAQSVQTFPVNEEIPSLSLGKASFVAGGIGFISLGFEIVWLRVFVLASSDHAPAFALLLSTFLGGVAAGAFIAGKLTRKTHASAILRGIAHLLFLAAAISCYLTPLVAWITGKGLDFMVAAPAFFLVASLLGAVFTLLCRLAIPVNAAAGRGVSLIYLSNIAGSASGCLLIGFVLLNYFGLFHVTLFLALAACAVGLVVMREARLSSGLFEFRKTAIPLAASVLPLVFAPVFSSHLYERLIMRSWWVAAGTFPHVIENRNGVIAVRSDGAVFGGGVYDGYFNIDPSDDKNLIARAYALSAFHAAPKHILMIGLSTGSWAQVLANHPAVESLEIVEINPGYLELIPQYDAVRSILQNPKVQIRIDDGRRWLLAHPNASFDVIVQNTSFFWRDHSSELLSADYLRLIRRHLLPGGVYYYNTTGSDDVVATGLSVFPYGLRVLNFLAVSGAPLVVDRQRWLAILNAYTIDGHRMFDSNSSPTTLAVLGKYMKLADSISQTPTADGMEDSNSLRARIKEPLIITDDNMGWEWRDSPGQR